MSCDCKCSVVLPRGDMGWSAICDSSSSWSYSLTLRLLSLTSTKTSLPKTMRGCTKVVKLLTMICPPMSDAIIKKQIQ